MLLIIVADLGYRAACRSATNVTAEARIVDAARAQRHLILRALQAFDLVVFWTTLAYVIYIYRANSANRADLLNPTWELFAWLIVSSIVWHFALASANLYRSHRLAGGFPVAEIFSGVSMGALGISALSMLMAPKVIPLVVIVQLSWMSALCLVVMRTILWCFLLGLRHRGRNLRFALIVGGGRRASTLISRIYEPSTGYRVIGFVDDFEQSELSGPNGVAYLGTLAMLPNILGRCVVDEVFMVLPVRSHYDSAAWAIRHCEEQGIRVRVPCDVFVPGKCSQYVDTIEGVPILSLVPSATSAWYDIIKRVFDFVASAVLLVLFAPMFIAVAVLVKRDSPGPVFFTQTRVGLNKRMFSLIKFRTMSANSEALQPQLEHLNEADGPVFKIRNDPRITRVGRFLRRSSIDEMPQLFNVLLGHMSLVGPRPLPLRDVERFEFDWQRRRFSIRPGITCLWQVHGRSTLSFDQWMKLDMLYIERRCLLLDFTILLQTVPAVLRKAGAY